MAEAAPIDKGSKEETFTDLAKDFNFDDKVKDLNFDDKVNFDVRNAAQISAAM